MGHFFSDFPRSVSWRLGNYQDENVLLFWQHSNEKHPDILTFPHIEASLDTEENMAISVRSVGEPSVLASQKPSIIATLLFFLASALFP